MRLAARLRQCVALLLLAGAMCGAAPTATPIAAPPENRRGEDQTFLTFPEWYLVYSPAEYAVFVVATGHPAPSHWPGVASTSRLILRLTKVAMWNCSGAYRERRWAGPC